MVNMAVISSIITTFAYIVVQKLSAANFSKLSTELAKKTYALVMAD